MGSVLAILQECKEHGGVQTDDEHVQLKEFLSSPIEDLSVSDLHCVVRAVGLPMTQKNTEGKLVRMNQAQLVKKVFEPLIFSGPRKQTQCFLNLCNQVLRSLQQPETKWSLRVEKRWCLRAVGSAQTVAIAHRLWMSSC